MRIPSAATRPGVDRNPTQKSQSNSVRAFSFRCDVSRYLGRFSVE